MLARLARDGRVPVAYVNLVGGNDELVFDGGSIVLDDRGRVAPARRSSRRTFSSSTSSAAPDGRARVVAVPGGSAARRARTTPTANPLESLRRALVLGIRDYARKCGFRPAVLGLSGGIDSALVAALAVEALGTENVTGLGMPSPFSSEGSVADARALAENLGIRFEVLPIGPLFAAAKGALGPLFAGRPEDVTEENVQSRLRGLLLMALLEQVRAARPDDREQERARGRLLHALRRHVRRPRPDLGPPEDARLRARPAPQRARRRGP